jgi:hypothetical protein
MKKLKSQTLVMAFEVFAKKLKLQTPGTTFMVLRFFTKYKTTDYAVDNFRKNTKTQTVDPDLLLIYFFYL